MAGSISLPRPMIQAIAVNLHCWLKIGFLKPGKLANSRAAPASRVHFNSLPARARLSASSTARIIPAALLTVSCHSLAGTLSATTPAPA